MPVRLAAAVLALLAAGACSGGEKKDVSVPVPQGFQEFRAAAYGFAYPAGWQRKQDKDEQGRPSLSFNGPVLPSGAFDGQVHVQRYEGGRYQDIGTALSQFRGLARMNRYRLTTDRPVKVGGAVSAHRFEGSYEIETEGGERIPFKVLGLYALTEKKTLVEFMLRSPQQGQAAQRLPEILDSFRLRGE